MGTYKNESPGWYIYHVCHTPTSIRYMYLYGNMLFLLLSIKLLL